MSSENNNVKLNKLVEEKTSNTEKTINEEGNMDENVMNVNAVIEQEENNSVNSEELMKWQKELADKEKSLKEEELRLKKENAALEEKRTKMEADAKIKIQELVENAKGAEAKRQQESREKLNAEFENSRKEFDEKRQKDLANLDKEMSKIRENAAEERQKELNAFKSELEKMKQECDSELNEKRDKALNELQMEIAERTKSVSERESKVNADMTRISTSDANLRDREKALDDEKDKLEDEKRVVEREKRRFDRERQRIDEANSDLEKVVNERFQDTLKKRDAEIEAKERELDSLRSQLTGLISELDSIKSFKDAYGEDPAVIKKRILDLTESNDSLRERIANCSDKAELDRLLDENRLLQERVDKSEKENVRLNTEKEQYVGIEAEYNTIKVKNKALEAQILELQNIIETKDVELLRLSAPEARLADRDERIAALKQGILVEGKDLIGAGLPNELDEIKWLDGIWEKCKEYGITFHRRILYAFHTALKINEWSTVTVLAGVSGTGKSELPRLYSAFGGLNFNGVAVQPNWDSQESMLGFFNSIDNRFEPEPLLRFLVQCTEDEKYKDYMSIVLLDEMNLAYVEHYFAEFLSKLEARRGTNKKELPNVEVKLGAGVESYKLPLARTILWTGTMNQDETTKSLSDKVLDRGIVINFPRPKKLSSRASMGVISKYIGNNRPMLHKSTWATWTTHEIEFSEEQNKEIEHYKKIVEDINDCLEEVARALGHRVWQSIEYYIANYPTVRRAKDEAKDELTGDLKAAMKIAFEDQIVQKIMPKLRGIETRGKGSTSLQKIEDLLENEGFENLKDDFEIACEQGYGQFMWSSAKYLGEDSDAGDDENMSTITDGGEEE